MIKFKTESSNKQIIQDLDWIAELYEKIDKKGFSKLWQLFTDGQISVHQLRRARRIVNDYPQVKEAFEKLEEKNGKK